MPAVSTVRAVRCTVEVPAHGELPEGAVDRLRRALGEPLPGALAERLAGWAEVDPGSVWVLRRVRTVVPVPASEPVPGLAERLAAGVAGAVGRALRAGLGTEVMRFASRAEQVAAFVAALATGSGDVWAFDRFDGLRLLAPLTALRTAGRAAGCTVAEVIAELARADRLDVVVARATGAEVARAWAVCCDELGATPMPVDHAVSCLAGRTQSLPPRVVGESWPAHALRLLGAAGRMRLVDREVVGAILTLLPEADAADAPGADILADRSRPVRTLDDADSGDVEVGRAGRPAGEPRAAAARIFASRGATAFLVLPSFAGVGLARLDPAVRAAALAMALGVDIDDPAVTLAAGADPDDLPRREGHPAGELADRVTGDLVSALAEDVRLDLSEVAVTPAHLPAGGTAWVGRDVATDTWLATVSGDEASPPARLGELLAELLDGHAAVVGWPSGDGREDRDLDWLLSSLERGDDRALDLRLATALVAREGLRHLARRLLGFERSSLRYIVDRFLTPGGIVADDGHSILVELPAPPLQVVLTMAGLDTIAYRVPWLDRDVVVTHPDR